MFAAAAVLAILKRASWFCFATVLRDERKKRAVPIGNCPVWINNLYLSPTEWLNAVERGLLPVLRPGELPVNHCGSVGGNCC